MMDAFTQITEPLRKEGMTAEAATLLAVRQEASRVAAFYLTLHASATESGKRIQPKHCLELTCHWIDAVQERSDDEDED